MPTPTTESRRRPDRSRRLTAAALALAATTIGGFVATAPPASAQSGWRVCGYITSDGINTPEKPKTAVILKIPKGNQTGDWNRCSSVQNFIKLIGALDPDRKWNSVRRMECEDLFHQLNLPDECRAMPGPHSSKYYPTWVHYGIAK